MYPVGFIYEIVSGYWAFSCMCVPVCMCKRDRKKVNGEMGSIIFRAGIKYIEHCWG